MLCEGKVMRGLEGTRHGLIRFIFLELLKQIMKI